MVLNLVTGSQWWIQSIIEGGGGFAENLGYFQISTPIKYYHGKSSNNYHCPSNLLIFNETSFREFDKKFDYKKYSQ